MTSLRSRPRFQTFITRLAVALLVLGAIGIARAASAELNLFIWSEYIDPYLLKEFETQFRCKVNVDLYEDAESMMAKLQAGGASQYDVVVPPDHLVAPMIKLNLLAPLRRENLSNLPNIEPQFANPAYDPSNRFTVAYQWGTVGILARRNSGVPLPDTWGLFFDPKLQPRSFVLIDSMRDMLGAALKYKGASLNSTNVTELRSARDLILSAKRKARGFDGSVAAKNKVLSGAVEAAIVYSGEGVRAMQENASLLYFIPREGSQIWVDNLAVPVGAPHRDLAEKFINWALEPAVAARNANFTRFATPIRGALDLVRPADRSNTAIYPPEPVIRKLEVLRDLGGRTRLYDEVWTQIKSR